jgi:pimeloyl-ACP methyl ester carboxylesterase
VAVDRATLASLNRFEEPALGLSESFLTPSIGGAATVAVLSSPLGGARETGWVVCHSFAMEYVNLQPIEVSMARRLAREGFHTLRYHAQGYGDSERPAGDGGLAGLVRDASDAVRIVREVGGVRRVGLIGARLGGTVAALAAERGQANAVVMWNPVIQGGRYLRSMVKAALVTEMARRGRPRSIARHPRHELEERGVLEVEGYPLRRDVFEELSGLNLVEALHRPPRHSLLLNVSASPKLRPEVVRLAQRLRELGGEATVQVVEHPEARMFGRQRYLGTEGGRKVDTQASISEDVMDRTLSWCEAVEDWDEPGAGG